MSANDKNERNSAYSKLFGRCRGEFEEFTLESRQYQHDEGEEEPDPCMVLV
jgi:hypothetical protein